MLQVSARQELDEAQEWRLGQPDPATCHAASRAPGGSGAPWRRLPGHAAEGAASQAGCGEAGGGRALLSRIVALTRSLSGRRCCAVLRPAAPCPAAAAPCCAMLRPAAPRPAAAAPCCAGFPPCCAGVPAVLRRGSRPAVPCCAGPPPGAARAAARAPGVAGLVSVSPGAPPWRPPPLPPPPTPPPPPPPPGLPPTPECPSVHGLIGGRAAGSGKALECCEHGAGVCV